MTPDHMEVLRLFRDLLWLVIQILTVPAAIALAAVFVWHVVIPHHRETRRLKAEGRCIGASCGRKLPDGDKGPLCGDCWAEEKAW